MRRSLALADDDVFHILDVVQKSSDADGVGRAALLDITRPATDVVALQGLDDLLKRQPESDQLHRVGLHVILLLVAADNVDAGNSLDILQLRTDDPVLHLAQIRGQLDFGLQPLAFGCEIDAVRLPTGLAVDDRRSVARWVSIFDRPHVDLAEPRGDRSHLRLDAARQVLSRFPQSLVDLIAGEIDVDIVGENGRYLRKAVARKRPRILQAVNPRQCRLDRKRHLPLDLLG